MNIQTIKEEIKALQTKIDKLSEIVEEQENKVFPFGTLYGKEGTNNVYTIFRDIDGLVKILNITYGKVWQKQLNEVYHRTNGAGWNYLTYKQLYKMLGEDANKLFQLDKININNNSLTTKLTRNA